MKLIYVTSLALFTLVSTLEAGNNNNNRNNNRNKKVPPLKIVSVDGEEKQSEIDEESGSLEVTPGSLLTTSSLGETRKLTQGPNRSRGNNNGRNNNGRNNRRNNNGNRNRNR